MPFRTAAECIDWSIPCPSIFDRKRPLAEKTCRRIANGIVRYVLSAARPFIVPVNHGDGWKNAGARDRSIDRPAPTLTASRGEYLVAPSLAQVGWGEREGQAPRCMDVERPLGSVVAGGGKHALVSAFLSQYWGGMVGKPADVPLPTTTGKGPHEALVAASLVRHCQNGSNGPGCADAEAPLSTIVSKAEHSIAAAHLVKIRGESNGQSVEQPAPTITSGAGAARPAGAAHAMGIAAACLTQFRGSNNGSGGDVAEPVPSITSQGRHAGLVLAFLTKYYGQGFGSQCADPLPTATVRHRFGVVQVEVAPGEIVDAASVVVDGERYVITDIGLRMLSPRELARCQGFPDSYVLTGTQANQVARIGNSVPPPVVSALVWANVGGGA